MIASRNSAKLWKWTDYTTGDSWLVATTWWGFVLLAFVGVWLSFSARYIKQILANLALWVHWHLRTNEARLRNQGEISTERDPLLGEQESRAGRARRAEAERDLKDAKVLAKVYKDKDGVRDLALEFVFNQELTRKYRTRLFGFIVFVSVISVGFIIGGVSLAWIKSTNGPALLKSQKCGLWVFDRSRGGDEAATRAGLNDLEKETRAGEYAHNCYGTPDPFDAIQCDFLYRRSLTFSPPEYTTDCSFKNEICGQNQTVTFKSAMVAASDLGINSEKPPTFNRTTSCTPLSMEYPFIQNETRDGVTTYYYYYGEKPSHNPPVNYTYTTTGDPFDGFAPAYDVFPYITNTTDTVEPYWKPRPELTYPEFSTLTLIFVSSQRILYKKWSDDPIFPADKMIILPGEQKAWFRNSDPRARPLACIDSIDVCLGDGKTCWPMNGHIPKDSSGNLVPTPPEFWLMYASLLKTNIYNSIEKRLGRGLLAQKLVSQYFSEALGDDHWVDEVQNLVATSLARTQINAWSIASGEDSVHEGKDRYVEITKGLGDLCGIFKYNPPGIVSIHFVPLILTLISFPVFWILSLKVALITRASTALEVVGSAPGPPEPQDGEQEQPATQSSDTTQTAAGATDSGDAADNRRTSSVNAPLDQGERGSQDGVDTEPVNSYIARGRSPPRSEEFQDTRQGQNAPPFAEQTATDLALGEAITRAPETAGQSGESSSNVPRDDGNERWQDGDPAISTNTGTAGATSGHQSLHDPSRERPILQPDEPAVLQRPEAEETRTVNNGSNAVEWQPLLINNVFELIYCLIWRQPIRPCFEPWPKRKTVEYQHS